MRMTLNHCLLLSLALHGALLAVYRPQPRLGTGTSTLMVTLIDGGWRAPVAHSTAPAITSMMTEHIPTSTALTRARAHAAHPHTPVRNTSLARAEPSATTVHPFRPPSRSTSSDPSSTTAPNGTANALEDGDRAQTIAWLQTRLLGGFVRYYPMLARRHGWEGRVQLALRIEPDGHVSHLQLAQSSGYAALDEAALASAQRIEVLDDVATRLHGAYLDMVLPIEYRLLGG
jgi:protein TonB